MLSIVSIRPITATLVGRMSFLLAVSIGFSWSLDAQDASALREVRTLEIGTVFEIHSRLLNENRTVSVSLPTSYGRSETEYPLVVVMDGENYLPVAAQAVRFLAQYRLMPEAVVVGIHNTDRRRDLTPPDISLPDVPRGRADTVLSFLAEELIPVLESSYRLLPLRILIGHSHGGLFDVYALSARPDLFRWHIAIDAPMQLGQFQSDKRMREFFARNPEHVGRLISIERTYGWGDGRWNAFADAAPSRFSLTRLTLPDETHETMVYRGFYEGLKWLFRDLSFQNDSLATLSELKATYGKLSEAYGYPVPVPRSILLMGAEDLLFVGRTEQASELLEEFRRLYGSASELEGLETWLAGLKRDPLREPFDQLLASPKPSAQAIRPYVGTWEGYVEEMHPFKIRVTISVVGGKPSVSHRLYYPRGDDAVGSMLDVPYLRVRENGDIEWGHMNGMRPRTMIVAYTGRVDSSGQLVGLQQAKGISWPPEAAPFAGRQIRFSLRRIPG